VQEGYECFVKGSVEFEYYGKIWKTWAPAKCRYFVWLVANNKCLTADRLAKRGMDHSEKYPLCDQEEESIDHLLLSCMFARQGLPLLYLFLKKAVLVQPLSAAKATGVYPTNRYNLFHELMADGK
jgi:hypothetical protein